MRCRRCYVVATHRDSDFGIGAFRNRMRKNGMLAHKRDQIAVKAYVGASNRQ